MKRILFLALIFVWATSSAQIVYHDAREFPIYGKAVLETSGDYERLPVALEKVSRQPLWYLGRQSAGLALRFKSNSSSISARWTSTFQVEMNHMCPTGIRGLDLYAWVDGGWRFVNSGRPDLHHKESSATIIANMEPTEREYMLYLSLYDGVERLEIGVDSLSTISTPMVNAPQRDHPVVFYGTSILQGGCVTRPGMAHTNIISRRLNREVINLGFSGNGRLDLEIAHLMAEVNAGVFVLDCAPNVSNEDIRTKLEPFFRILRERHPLTPVVFVEDPHFAHARFDKRIAQEVKERNEAMKEMFHKFKREGAKNIYYVSSEDMLGDDGEATVDGIHFTDLGMMRYADLLTPVLRKLLP